MDGWNSAGLVYSGGYAEIKYKTLCNYICVGMKQIGKFQILSEIVTQPGNEPTVL